MGILRVDHPDVMEFISCKEDLTQITNFNISVGITTKFMEALKTDAMYDLVDPVSKQVTGPDVLTRSVGQDDHGCVAYG